MTSKRSIHRAIFDTLYNNSIIKWLWFTTRAYTAYKSPTKLSPRRKPRVQILGKTAKNPKNTLPRVIWTYWTGPQSPTVAACIKSWKKFAPTFDIRLIGDEDISSLLPDFPALPDQVTAEKRSNLIRLMLIERHGGIWMDGSTLLSESLEWVPAMLEALNAEVLAFASDFRGIFRHSDRFPVIENSFLAAPPGNSFIANWRAEYQRCIQSKNYKEYYSNDKDYSKYIDRFIYRDKTFMEYMVCFISCQKVLMEKPPSNIALINSSDDLFYLRTATKHPFRTRELAEALLLHSPPLTRITKLTSGDRRWSDEYIRHGCFKHSSALGRHITPCQETI
jgi:hypothetical protein